MNSGLQTKDYTLQITYSLNTVYMNIKRTLGIIFIAIAITTIANAQTNNNIMLYGYIQPVLPGITAKGDIDENGRMIKKNTGGVMNNYRIYITAPSNFRIYPIAIWIKSTPYSAKSEVITNTPVVLTNHTIPSHPQTTTLVPKTTQKVWQITPLPPIESKLSAKAKVMAQTNELVVSYKLNGKYYYAALEKLTELPSGARQ